MKAGSALCAASRNCRLFESYQVTTILSDRIIANALMMEIRSPLAVEGVNYVGDTLLFAATALLVGFDADTPENQNLNRSMSDIPFR